MKRALVLSALAACGGKGIGSGMDQAPIGPPVTLAPSGIGLHPGEAMTYVTTLDGLEAGEVAIGVGEPGQVDGRRAVIVAARVSLTGVFGAVKYMRADTDVITDLDTGAPISLAGELDWGGKHMTAEGRFDGSRGEMSWFHGGNLESSRSHDIGTGTLHSVVTAVATLRTWNGTPGERATLHMLGPLELWKIELVWVGADTIDTALGRYPAIRIDGETTIEGGVDLRMSFWLTDDGDRVPLRIHARSPVGPAKFEITSYRSGH